MAASYALMFTGNVMVQEYNRINSNIEKGNMEEMQVVSNVVHLFSIIRCINHFVQTIVTKSYNK